jgi:hypothetical protein
MISFVCPTCSQVFSVSVSMAGKRSTCPRCKSPIKVPTVTVPERADVAPTAPPPRLSAGGEQSPAPWWMPVPTPENQTPTPEAHSASPPARVDVGQVGGVGEAAGEPRLNATPSDNPAAHGGSKDWAVIGATAAAVLAAALVIYLIWHGPRDKGSSTSMRPIATPPKPAWVDPDSLAPAEGARRKVEEWLTDARDRGGKEIEAVKSWRILTVSSNDNDKDSLLFRSEGTTNVTTVRVAVDHANTTSEVEFVYLQKERRGGGHVLVFDRIRR